MRKQGWERQETRFAKIDAKETSVSLQVHAQQSNVYNTEGSFLQVRHDAVEPIDTLTNSKFALDNVSVTDILMPLFLCPLRHFRALGFPGDWNGIHAA